MAQSIPQQRFKASKRRFERAAFFIALCTSCKSHHIVISSVVKTIQTYSSELTNLVALYRFEFSAFFRFLSPKLYTSNELKICYIKKRVKQIFYLKIKNLFL